MDKSERARIVALVKKQVVPAVGCTEPMAVALCVAKAREVLGHEPQKVEVQLSANILKNAMGVGIPGTGMTGLPIAVALGAIVGRSDYGLEVLKDVDEAALQRGNAFVAEDRIKITLKQNCCDKLYIETCVECGDDRARAVIQGNHTHFVTVERNGTVLLSNENEDETDSGHDCNEMEWLTLRKVYEFATEAPLEEICFIDEAAVMNRNAAAESLKGNYGHELGKTLSRPMGRGIMGDSMFSHIVSTTAAACDARMAGAMVPVMSNSGSGNQGICATLPVVVFAEENHNTDEERTRALMLSHLTAIYMKQSLGCLSALCGCVVASTGSSVGITYLMGGGYDQVCASVKNMVANLTGMICDGAKPACALKLASGVSTAVMSSLMAMQNKCVSSVEGIIDDCVDKSIHNLTRIGHDAMDETDRCVLEIMTHK